jgi:hypothetical protein
METTAAGAPRAQTLRDLAEEGKKRGVLLLVFAFGLAFLMSRESSGTRIFISLLVPTFAAHSGMGSCASAIQPMRLSVYGAVIRVMLPAACPWLSFPTGLRGFGN